MEKFGRSAGRDQNAIKPSGSGRGARPGHTSEILLSSNFQVHAQTNGKLGAKNRSEFFSHLLITKPSNMIASFEHLGVYTESGQSLCDLKSQRTGANHRDRSGKGGKVKDGLIGKK